jgi:phosphoribosyl 1,2-cyclic phosphate phosphodiesterase
MGVPTIACPCAVCHSTDPHDHRTRPSLLIEYDNRHIVVDTTPDFRAQALAAHLTRLDAVLFTHAHADHVMGLDDIRPFNLKQHCSVPIYASPETLGTLQRIFAYIFDPAPVESSLPQVELHPINPLDQPFDLFGQKIIPIPALHGPNPVLGFRFGNLAYLTDFSTLPDFSKPLLQNLDHFILDALRDTPHPMHSSVSQSLALVAELKPRHAWFTHICHDLAHEATNQRLPENVRLSYDGLVLESRFA